MLLTCSSNKHTIFPVSLFVEVIEILRAKEVEFGLYGDLNMSGALSTPRWRYLGEYTRWKTVGFGPIRVAWAAGLLFMTRTHWPVAQKLARRLDRKRDAPLVFMQHDADRIPFRTYDLLEVERQLVSAARTSSSMRAPMMTTSRTNSMSLACSHSRTMAGRLATT